MVVIETRGVVGQNGVVLTSPEQTFDHAALVREHLPLVHHAVASLSMRVPRSVSWDELCSAGMVGLVEAARSYDGSRGVPFTAFATMRIRGALLDELRS